MSKTDIGNTLRDIAEESGLSLAEKVSLKRIAKEYDKLQDKNELLQNDLKELGLRLKAIGEGVEQTLKGKTT